MEKLLVGNNGEARGAILMSCWKGKEGQAPVTTSAEALPIRDL